MQIVFNGDNLHEMSNPVSRKNKKKKKKKTISNCRQMKSLPKILIVIFLLMINWVR